MILTDNETHVDLLNNEALAAAIVAVLGEQPARPITIGVHRGLTPLLPGFCRGALSCGVTP
jgi:hypothetical protein